MVFQILFLVLLLLQTFFKIETLKNLVFVMAIYFGIIEIILFAQTRKNLKFNNKFNLIMVPMLIVYCCIIDSNEIIISDNLLIFVNLCAWS